MAGDVLFPSLSEDGWVDSTPRKADYMMAHFVAADFSQSYNYIGNIVSFPYILATNQGDMPGILSSTQQSLMSFFSHYFAQVSVDVTETDTGESSKAAISIAIAFVDYQGKQYNFAKLIKTMNSKFMEIIDINNG